MDAIHVNWTSPFSGAEQAPYEAEDFDILTTIISALKWREKNGNITMVTDKRGAVFYTKYGLDAIWDNIDISLDGIDVNGNVFWAAGKIFALSRQKAPIAMIDTDFIVWDKIEADKLTDVTIVHYEDLYPDVYPAADFFCMEDYTWDEGFDWNLKACNTAFCVIKNGQFLKYYTDQSIRFMHHARGGDDRLRYMVFAEQRLIAMCAKRMGVSLSAFSDLGSLFSGKDTRFTHTWGMKQQMRDDPKLRYDFCLRCVNRILREYPHMKQVMEGIPSLGKYTV